MAVFFKCPKCGKRLAADDGTEREWVFCIHCHCQIQVPEPPKPGEYWGDRHPVLSWTILLASLAGALTLVALLVLFIREAQKTPFDGVTPQYFTLYRQALSREGINRLLHSSEWPSKSYRHVGRSHGKLVAFQHYEGTGMYHKNETFRYLMYDRFDPFPVAKAPGEVGVLVVIKGNGPGSPSLSHYVAFTALEIPSGRLLATGRARGESKVVDAFTIPGPGGGVAKRPTRVERKPVDWVAFEGLIAQSVGFQPKDTEVEHSIPEGR